jgi:hypothetical protein
MSANHRVLILYPYTNVSTNPTMQAIVDALGDSGIGVDLAAVSDIENQYPAFRTTNRDFGLIPSADLLQWDVSDVPLLPLPPPQVSVVRRVARRVRRVIRAEKQCFVPQSLEARLSVYSYIIGVDPAGVAAAARLCNIAGLPLVYISFEIMLTDEVVGAYELRLKAAEKRAAQQSCLIMIQDEQRAKVFTGDNGVDLERVCLIPVAPKDSSPCRTNYLRRRLGIGEEKKIVLFQGTIAPWSGRYEWEELINSWPEHVVLVVHSRSRLNARHQKFLRMLAKSGRVFATDEPVPADELPLLTASADIGLVSYFPSPDSWYDLGNLEFVGHASGKFSYFMMCGIPVLVNDHTSLASIVRSSQVGAVYTSPAESRGPLLSLLDNWGDVSVRSRQYYLDVLDPRISMSGLTTRLSTAIDCRI